MNFGLRSLSFSAVPPIMTAAYYISSPSSSNCSRIFFTFLFLRFCMYSNFYPIFILITYPFSCAPTFQRSKHIFFYIEPSFFRTTIIVLKNIFISSPIFQFVIYSLSRRTTSSKSVISLRPLTCHMPVIPGLIASLARW